MLKTKIEQMQEEHEKIYKDLIFISEKDREDAESVGAEVIRLFPDRMRTSRN